MKVLLLALQAHMMSIMTLQIPTTQITAEDIHIIPVHGDHIYTADITETQD